MSPCIIASCMCHSWVDCTSSTQLSFRRTRYWAKLLQNLENYMHHVGWVSARVLLSMVCKTVKTATMTKNVTCISSLLIFVFVTRKCKSSSESELLLDFPPMVLQRSDEIPIENGRIVVCKFTRFYKITINDNFTRLFAASGMLLTAGLTAAVRCHHSILLAAAGSTHSLSSRAVTRETQTQN